MNAYKWCVYMHTNKINGKRYIGITSQEPEKRWMNGSGYSEMLPFGRAIRKYGWENFEHKILLDKLPEHEAKCLEVYLISILGTQNEDMGYNITSGGDGVRGFHHTDEPKRKMSSAKTGCNHPNYGKHLSEMTRAKISEKLIGNKNGVGIIVSNETRRKISIAKQKPVVMLNTASGSIIQTFDSAKIAEDTTGISRKNISLCCLGHRKRAGGYAWQFA